MKNTLLIFMLLLFSGFPEGAFANTLVFTNEDSTWDGSDFVIDVNDEVTTDIDLKFGTTATGRIRLDLVNDNFEINKNVDFEGNEVVNVRLENNAVAPTCDLANAGRIYYDTVADSPYVCEETAPSTYTWVDFTVTVAATSSKVVTVGTGGNYATIAAAVAYLNPLTGGVILLTSEAHSVTTSVDLENIILIGANPDQSIIQITGGGVLEVKDTVFENLSIDIDSGITADAGLDVKSGGTSSSVVFKWTNFVTGGAKSLMNSTAGTAPSLIARFENPSALSGTATIVPVEASAGLDVGNSIFLFSSQGESGTLQMNDWDISISGASNVLSSGTITTTPNDTIFAYPGMNLQAALDSLSSGGILTLLPGTHSISSPLVITNDGITLNGYGDASIIGATGFSGIGTTTAAIQIGIADGTSPVSGVLLNDFRLEVNNTDIHGIRAAGGTDITVSNITVEKTAGTAGNGANAKIGILLMDGSATPLIRPVIKSSRVFGAAGRYFTDGIHVSGEGAVAGLFGNGNGVQNALVEGNSVDYVRETAAAFVHVSDSSLFNNRFSNMGGGGGGAYGIYMGRIARTNMTNNIVSGSLSATSIAIGVESFNIGADPTTQNSVFTGNVIDGSANGGVGFGTGFQIGATTGTTVQNNIFQMNGMLGASNVTTTAVEVRGNFDKNIFSGNNVSGGANAWDTGIILPAGADQNILRGNEYTNVTTFVNDGGADTKFGVAQHQSGSDPTVNDDQILGYTFGMLWVNTATDSAFILVDSTVGAAVWKQIDGGGGAGHTQNTDTGTTSNSFILDNDDTGGNVFLQFGATLAETLTWNNATTTFELSDGLNLADDLTVGGATETISDAGFVLNGDDVFIADSLGVEGAIYTDSTATKYQFIDIFGCVRGSASAGTVGGGNSPVIRFDSGTDSQMRCSFPVPDDWQAGTDILIETYWSPSDDTAGAIDFDLEYGSFGVGETIAGGSFTDAISGASFETVATTTQLDLYELSTAIPSASLALDDMVNFNLARTPGDAGDTYAADINIHMLRMSYTGKKLR